MCTGGRAPDEFALQSDEVYLNLILEFVPETIYRIIKHYSRTKRQVPTLYVKVPKQPLHPFFSRVPQTQTPIHVLTIPPPPCSCTCIRWPALSRTSISWGSVTGISSLRTCSSTRTRTWSNFATLSAPLPPSCPMPTYPLNSPNPCSPFDPYAPWPCPPCPPDPHAPHPMPCSPRILAHNHRTSRSKALRLADSRGSAARGAPRRLSGGRRTSHTFARATTAPPS